MAREYLPSVFTRLATGPWMPRRPLWACMTVLTALEKPSYSFSISASSRRRFSSVWTSTVSWTRRSAAAAAFFFRSSIRRLWPAMMLAAASASSLASSRARRFSFASCRADWSCSSAAALSRSAVSCRSRICALSATAAASSAR